jgi:pyrroline-5-carboxylate reductase
MATIGQARPIAASPAGQNAMTETAHHRHRLEAVHTLALVGAGKMGLAMLEGWLALGLDLANVAIFEPRPSPEVTALAARGASLNPPDDAVSNFAAVVLAVKPQVAPEVMGHVRAMLAEHTLVLSIMAGRTLSFLADALGDVAIVRAMPNTPAAIGRGMTVAVPNAQVTDAQRALADALLAATGAVEWIADERLMDAVTAVSGSGPAYVFLLAEALEQAAIEAGLPQPLSRRLARETVSGAGELLHRSELDAAVLRQNVTSPGGTTAAALEILRGEGGLVPLMVKAVAAAANRSRELAG